MDHLGTVLTRFDVKHAHVFGSNRLHAFRNDAFRRLADASQQAQDQMLAVGFDEEGVFVFAEGGLDEDIAEFGLEGWVEVELGLFHRD